MQDGSLTWYKLTWWYPSHTVDLVHLFQVVAPWVCLLDLQVVSGFALGFQDLEGFDFTVILQ